MAISRRPCQSYSRFHTQRSMGSRALDWTLATMSRLSRDVDLEVEANHLLHAAGHPELHQKISVFWDTRLRTTAGLADYRRKAIRLNPALRNVSVVEIDRTLRHELAHFLARHRSRARAIQAHGQEWKQACCDLGIPGEARCHTLPFEHRKLERKYFYYCPSCQLVIARVRRFKRPTACRVCCSAYNNGKYHARFVFVLQSKPPLTTPS